MLVYARSFVNFMKACWMLEDVIFSISKYVSDHHELENLFFYEYLEYRKESEI